MSSDYPLTSNRLTSTFSDPRNDHSQFAHSDRSDNSDHPSNFDRFDN